MKRILLIAFVGIGITAALWAGNEKRRGQAGATELLINPWARSAGWHAADAAGISGVEAMRFNPGAIVFGANTQLSFSRTTWLKGTDIYINAFGLVQHLGEEGDNALGISLMQIDFGEIMITTAEQPEGGLGTYSPQFINLGLAYSHRFSSTIAGGVLVRLISESLPDVSAMGAAVDAGVRYTSLNKRTRFGVSLRNVGTPMRFTGDGLGDRGTFEGSDVVLTLEPRSAKFDLPSLVHISGSHDVLANASHTVTLAANFTSHTYQRNDFVVGLRYSFKQLVSLRGGFLYQNGILDPNERQTAFTGLAGGLSLNLPMGKSRSLSFDYSYRATNPFAGVHAWSIGLNL